MVPNVPFWLSQANTEFGGGGAASTILSKAGIPAPRLLSQLGGRSAYSHKLTIGEVPGAVGGFVRGFRASVDVYENPQTAIGGLSPQTLGPGSIRTFICSTNLTDGISVAIKPVISSAQGTMTIIIPGLGTLSGTYNNGPTATTQILRGLQGVFDFFGQRVGQTIDIDIKFT